MSSVLKFIPVMHQNTAPPTHILFFKNTIIYYATIKNKTRTDFGGQNTEKREKLCVCVQFDSEKSFIPAYLRRNFLMPATLKHIFV